MKTVERKGKIHIQISFSPFLLFILTSILIHGVGILILALSNRELPTARQETESTPIDFVVVPPEESPLKPPPETERQAINNSIAKGKVEPELPSAADKIGNEEAIAKSEPSQVTQPVTSPSSPGKVSQPAIANPRPTPAPEVVKPTTPNPSIATAAVSQSPPVTSPSSLAKAPKPTLAPNSPTPAPEAIQPTIPNPSIPNTVETSPPVTSPSSPETVSPSALAPNSPTPAPEAIQPNPPSTSIPQTAVETSPTVTSASSPETLPQTALAPVIPQYPSLPSTPVSPAPSASSEQKTPVGSGSASLLGGTYRKTLSEDSGSSFFNPQANASQQALNPSGFNAQQNLNMGPYLAEIRRRVRRNWNPSSPGNNRHTVLVFSIQRNGQITGLRVIQSSGSDQVDRQSLEAVQKSGPFAALPQNFPHQELNVEFNFNIYVNQGVFRPQLENWQRF